MLTETLDKLDESLLRFKESSVKYAPDAGDRAAEYVVSAMHPPPLRVYLQSPQVPSLLQEELRCGVIEPLALMVSCPSEWHPDGNDPKDGGGYLDLIMWTREETPSSSGKEEIHHLVFTARAGCLPLHVRIYPVATYYALSTHGLRPMQQQPHLAHRVMLPDDKWTLYQAILADTLRISREAARGRPRQEPLPTVAAEVPSSPLAAPASLPSSSPTSEFVGMCTQGEKAKGDTIAEGGRADAVTSSSTGRPTAEGDTVGHDGRADAAISSNSAGQMISGKGNHAEAAATKNADESFSPKGVHGDKAVAAAQVSTEGLAEEQSMQNANAAVTELHGGRDLLHARQRLTGG